MDRHKAYQIIRHFVDGIIPAKYRTTVERWLVDEKDEALKEEGMFRVWNETDTTATSHLSQSLAHFRLRRSQYTASMHRSFLFRRALRYAAILALPIIAGAAVWLYTAHQSEEMIACTVPNGITKEVQLSDGTSVVVNSGSTLTYPKEFKGHYRRLLLSGEAHFKVAKDSIHPFIVKAGKLNVQVLGTHFNVKAYQHDNEIITTLEEGAVKLYEDQREKIFCILSPNEQAVYNKESGKFVKEKVDALNYSSWTQGDMNFDNQSVTQIIATLRRRFNVQFVVEPDINLNRLFTIHFKSSERLDDVLIALTRLSGDILYKQDGKVVKLSKEP